MANPTMSQTTDSTNQPINTNSINVDVSQPNIKCSWRFESRIVAYIDLVVGALSLLILVPGAVYLTYAAVATDILHWNETYHEQVPILEEENWNVVLGLTFAIVYVAILVCIVEIWAANQLRLATTANREPKEALPGAQIWMRVNLILLILSYLSLIQGYSRWSAVIWVLFRSARVIAVYVFVRELKGYEEAHSKNIKYDPNNPQVTITFSPAT